MLHTHAGRFRGACGHGTADDRVRIFDHQQHPAGRAGLTVGLYEIAIRRRNAVRLLFGMKPGRPTVVQIRAAQAARVNVTCVTPLGEETASTR